MKTILTALQVSFVTFLMTGSKLYNEYNDRANMAPMRGVE